MDKHPFKLTMVSVWFRGVRRVVFAYLPYVDGKAIASTTLINAQLPANVPNGCTFSIGI